MSAKSQPQTTKHYGRACWDLHNLMAYVHAVHPEATQKVWVLCQLGDTLLSHFGILRGGPT